MQSFIQRLALTVSAVGLGAAAVPALAVTSISACGSITQAGSYRLTQDLIASGNCLRIEASNVTLDLQGHTIKGNGSGDGISANDFLANIEVRNGTVVSFDHGVNLVDVSNTRVERIRALNNGGIGIYVSEGSIVTSNFARQNGLDGIMVRRAFGQTSLAAALVTDNLVMQNKRFGISVDNHPGSTIARNVSRLNGLNGIDVTCPANVHDNTITRNPQVNLLLKGSGCLSSNNLISPF